MGLPAMFREVYENALTVVMLFPRFLARVIAIGI